MKMNVQKTIAVAAVIGMCGCFAPTSAKATTITLTLGSGASYAIGQVFGSASNGGEPQHDNDDITQFLGMAPSVSGNFTIPEGTYFYQRTSLSTAGLSLDTTTESYNGAGNISGLTHVTIGGEAYIQFTLPSVVNPYSFLLPKYDGPNGGGELYYVGGFAPGTTINIPLNADVAGSGGVTNLVDVTSGGYGMTSFVIVSGTRTNVPDGGATALLLGAAVCGIGLIRRKLS